MLLVSAASVAASILATAALPALTTPGAVAALSLMPVASQACALLAMVHNLSR